jgi:hypothetical protein
MNTTLEEERRALLEQIEASRVVYRRMLSGSDSNASKGTGYSSSAAQHAGGIRTMPSGFPRSHTMRWIIAYRWQLAIGVTAAIILLGPGRKLADQPVVGKLRGKVRAIPRSGAVYSAVAAGTRLLGSRNSLRAAGKIAGLLMRWMQEQRTRSSS